MTFQATDALKREHLNKHFGEDYHTNVLRVFTELGDALHSSRHLEFDRTVLIKAWNLQAESDQKRIHSPKLYTPLSLERKFYVYALLDPRKPGKYEYRSECGRRLVLNHEPFYVGKGQGKRITEHYKNAIRDSENSHKANLIKRLHKAGLKPIEVRLSSHHEIEAVAFIKESMLIKAIGRIDTGTGTLTNATDGGEGTSGLIMSEKSNRLRRQAMSGRVLTTEHRDKLSKSHTGKILSEEHRKSLRKARANVIMSDATRLKLSNSLKGNKNNLGNVRSVETRMRMSASNKNRPVAICQGCGYVGKENGAFKRWHGTNCRVV
jgi:hypothetical protein